MRSFGAFRPTLVALSGRNFLERKRRGMDQLSKCQIRNRKKREAVVMRNAEVLREGERLLAIQLMTDHRNALAAASGDAAVEQQQQQQQHPDSGGPRNSSANANAAAGLATVMDMDVSHERNTAPSQPSTNGIDASGKES